MSDPLSPPDMLRRSDEAMPEEAQMRELEELLLANPHDSSLHFQLGSLLWKLPSDEPLVMKEKASQHFVVSARLDPLNAEPFKYLGHYYAQFAFDPQRSIKCYQRAVSLNPNDSESGEALCDLLDNSGKESLQIALCNDARRNSSRAFWAFKRLGLMHLHHKDYSQAVHCLQSAIRGYPACPLLWEALGLSYHRLGMFTAATKAYSRAIELDDTSVLALVESGNIFVILGSFGKAVENFKLARKIAPDNLSLIYGLASALLCWSKECMNLGAFRWGALLLEEAYQFGSEATCMAGSFSALWKLLGDIKLTYARCFPWTDENQFLISDSESLHYSIVNWREHRYLAAASAKTSYQRALHLAPWQASLYIDISVTSDFMQTFSDSYTHDMTTWKLQEKMALGALLLEGCNSEFWVILGCITMATSLKQHAFIRGLQLNLSLAIAWASVATLYREEGDLKLARKAFDLARSMDPSLALSWAGIAADDNTLVPKYDEAFEICLQAVQILPLAEFQIGLAKLALLSGNSASSEVYVGIQQAVQLAPHYPESHNLKGVICEARGNYEAAILSYQLARTVELSSFGRSSKLFLLDIANNLARCFCKAGNAASAARECQNLKAAGMLDERGLQIYAFSLWQLGKNDLALSVVEDLIAAVSTREIIEASSVTLLCRLIYYICNIDSSIDFILKIPKRWFESWRVAEVIFAIHALDKSNSLGSTVSTIYSNNTSRAERINLHYLMAIAKLFKFGSESTLGFKQGIKHLKRALHIYPESSLLRVLLGCLMLSSQSWGDNHLAGRCVIDLPDLSCQSSLKSKHEIVGAASFSCHAIGIKSPTLSFPTCSCQCPTEPGSTTYLQRYIHQKPWNHNLRYLLILNLFQEAREERFPKKSLHDLESLISISLSNGFYTLQYQKFQLLLCAAEVNLQLGNLVQSTMHTDQAKSLMIPKKYLFFCHLFLSRLHAAQDNSSNLQEEFLQCICLKTDHPIGWICLKVLELKYHLPCNSDIAEEMFNQCSSDYTDSWHMWQALFNLVVGLSSFGTTNVLSAENFLSKACSLGDSDPCLLLCHGAVCMEAIKRLRHTHLLLPAITSLRLAEKKSTLPVVCLLLAQGEGSLGFKSMWEKALRQEWYSWPPDRRPAEVFFQAHLQPNNSRSENPIKLVLKAIHTNPSCRRYWNAMTQIA